MGLLTDNVFGLYYWIFLLATSSSPNNIDFPLGQNKRITIDVGRNFVEKPYAISLRMEYPNGGNKKTRLECINERDKYPYNFVVTGYIIKLNEGG